MNFYDILNIPYNSNLLDICNAYQIKCQNNPENTFLYTKIFNVLCNKATRIYYDALLFNKDILDLTSHINYDSYYIFDEYDLLPFIDWLEIFKNYFYETKYFTTNQTYHQLIEKWYDKIELILEHLKSFIESLYLL